MYPDPYGAHTIPLNNDVSVIHNPDLTQPPAYNFNDYNAYADLGLGVGGLGGLGTTAYTPFLNQSTFNSNNMP